MRVDGTNQWAGSQALKASGREFTTSDLRIPEPIFMAVALCLFVLGVGFTLLGARIDAESWNVYFFALALTTLPILALVLCCRGLPLRYLASDLRLPLVVTFALYFILGASIYIGDTVSAVASRAPEYVVTASDALTVLGLNTLGLSLAVGVSAPGPGSTTYAVTRFACGDPSRGSQNSTFLLIGLGGICVACRVMVWAYDIGWIWQDAEAITGILRQAGRASVLIVVVLIGVVRSSRAVVWGAALAIGLVVMGLTTFNKGDVALGLFGVGLGLAVRRGSLGMLLLSGVVALLLIGYLGRPVEHARNMTIGRAVSLPERIYLLGDGLQRRNDTSTENYSLWQRLNYTPSQAVAIELYQRNLGGDDYTKVLWTVVPRVLYDDKPVMSNAGADLYFKTTGHVGSSTGVGYFVDGYYQLGIAGVILFGLACGWIIRVCSAISKAVIDSRSIVFAPLTVLTCSVPLRVDGVLLVDAVGVLVMAVYVIGAVCVYRFVSSAGSASA